MDDLETSGYGCTDEEDESLDMCSGIMLGMAFSVLMIIVFVVLSLLLA